jgi:hypothetical protein
MNVGQLIERYFPGLEDPVASDILWNLTGFPGFYPTGNPEKDLSDQLARAKENIEGKLSQGLAANFSEAVDLCIGDVIREIDAKMDRRRDEK